LAHHFTEADLAESALSYWLRAGQRATTRSAYQEALRHLERGLVLLKTLPDPVNRDRRELDFQIALNQPLTAVRGWASPEFEARSERATALSEKLGDVQHLYLSLHAQSMHCGIAGKNRKARELAERLRRLAVHQGDRRMRLTAHNAMGLSLVQRGEFATAHQELEEFLALYDPERDRAIPWLLANPFAAASTYLTWAQFISGYPERAAKTMTRAFSYAAELNDAFTTCFVHSNALLLEQLSATWRQCWLLRRP
jgi:tetratricopeptide (TPR) repeat protein